MIPPVSHVSAMAAYALADTSVPDGKKPISLSQNESMRLPSPAAIAAAQDAAQLPHLYPDSNCAALCKEIGQVHGVNPDQIVCGNGSLDLIGGLARAYLEPGRAALAPTHAYPFFRTATQFTGARFDTAPETELTADVDALLAAVTCDTRVVFIANPGNPTSTRIPWSELLRLRAGLPGDVLMVIDEAYGEFADHLGEHMFALVDRGDTVVLRTFSKAYGLAGLRVGWGYFPPEIAGHLRKLLNPSNVTLTGQAAARIAMQDQAYMRETCRQTAEVRDAFASRIRAAGLLVPESFTNFLLIRFPSAGYASKADTFLRSEGVITRAQAGVGLPECLRATVGVADDMAFTAGLLEAWAIREGLT